MAIGLKVVYLDGRPGFDDAPKDFRWNLTIGGWTVAPEWDPNPWCGGGLHVWAWAQGYLDASEIWYRPDVVWLAVEYDPAEAVDLKGKIKVPRCKTIAISSNRKEITAFIQEHTPEDLQDPAGIVGVDIVEVEEGDVSVGDGGVAFVRGKGTARAGDGGHAIAGNNGTASAGDEGIAEAGDGGTAIAGRGGIAKVGDGGMAIAGSEGSAEAGVNGSVIIDSCGWIMLGKGGKLTINKGVHKKSFCVGSDGIMPDTLLSVSLDDDLSLVVSKDPLTLWFEAGCPTDET